MSLLVQECGLKLEATRPYQDRLMSLLVQECGLKHTYGGLLFIIIVTPCTGVWIET